jgi:hypothetical protein
MARTSIGSGGWTIEGIAPPTVRAALQTAATSFAVEVSAAPVHAKDEIEGVIAAQARNRGNWRARRAVTVTHTPTLWLMDTFFCRRTR